MTTSKGKRLLTVELTEAEHRQLKRLAEQSVRSKASLVRSWIASASKLETLEVIDGRQRV